jgi:hypothetical protein
VWRQAFLPQIPADCEKREVLGEDAEKAHKFGNSNCYSRKRNSHLQRLSKKNHRHKQGLGGASGYGPFSAHSPPFSGLSMHLPS